MSPMFDVATVLVIWRHRCFMARSAAAQVTIRLSYFIRLAFSEILATRLAGMTISWLTVVSEAAFSPIIFSYAESEAMSFMCPDDLSGV